VIAKEVKRRTDQVHRDMSEVIVNEGIQAVNETIAHHAAWTDERFERVEERLGGLELGQQTIVNSLNGLTIRVGNLETAYIAIYAQMGRMEERLSGKIDGLTPQIDGLAVRMDRVLAFAIKDERRLAEALKGEDGKE
jgi:hypothetical protein